MPLARVLISGGSVSSFQLAEGLSEEAECVEQALTENHGDSEATNTAVEECAKAPNVLQPATNELVWGAIGFLVVLAFLAKVGLPAIKKGMQARTDKIQGDIDAAERSRAEADQILEQYQRQLSDAKSESARIIEEARLQADSVRRDLATRAEEEAAGIRARAQEDISAASERAMTELRSKVSALSIDLAEKIVERNLDRDVQTKLVESFIDQVGTRR